MELSDDNEEDLLQKKELQLQKKRVLIAKLYTIMGDREMKDFDSKYVGDEKNWKKNSNCLTAFFTGKLLFTDYRIIFSIFMVLLLVASFMEICWENAND